MTHLGGITLQEDSVQREWLPGLEDTMVETAHKLGAKMTQVQVPVPLLMLWSQEDLLTPVPPPAFTA